ncbi:MAG: thioredoxin [Pseudomonadota bacterium]
MTSIDLGVGATAPDATPDAAGDLIKDTTSQDFAKDVLEASREAPVLVDFWAPWCGPCRQLTPVLEASVKAAKGAIRLVKMNIDEHPEVAGQLGVQSIPAVFAFSQGRPVDGFMGALPESQIKAFIKRILGDADPGAALEEVIEQAETLLGQGAVSDAATAFAAVLQQEPDNARAIGGMIKCLIESGETERARQTLDAVTEELAKDPAIASARAAVELAEQTADLGDIGPLEKAILADPNDHQSRFDLALALNARSDRLGAIDHLLEIVKRDREWNEDQAREQLLTFFEAWGPTDPMTVEGRRKLSTVLFS